jgi:hypothetical protein
MQELITKPATSFPLPTSHFPLPTSNFQLPTSSFPLNSKCRMQSQNAIIQKAPIWRLWGQDKDLNKEYSGPNGYLLCIIYVPSSYILLVISIILKDITNFINRK